MIDDDDDDDENNDIDNDDRYQLMVMTTTAVVVITTTTTIMMMRRRQRMVMMMGWKRWGEGEGSGGWISPLKLHKVFNPPVRTTVFDYQRGFYVSVVISPSKNWPGVLSLWSPYVDRIQVSNITLSCRYSIDYASLLSKTLPNLWYNKMGTSRAMPRCAKELLLKFFMDKLKPDSTKYIHNVLCFRIGNIVRLNRRQPFKIMQ